MVQSLGDEAVGTAAAKVLAKIGPAAFDDIQSALERNNALAKLNAARALSWMECDAKPAVDAILETLKSSTDWRLSVVLIQALGRLGPEAKDSVELLIELTTDAEKPVYRAGLDALGSIGDNRAVPILIAALNTEDAFDGGAAAKALGHMGLEASEAGPALLDLLCRGRKDQIDRYFLGEVVTAAARLELTEAIPRITELIPLRAETRLNAIVALSKFGPDAKAAIPDIVQYGLEHEWAAMRIASLKALAAMGRAAQQAIPAIQQLQADETDPEVLAAIEATLREVEP
jgi:HEAT repeat protein